MNKALTPEQIIHLFQLEGIKYVETSGWRTREVAGAFTPVGVCNHHTASQSLTPTPSLQIVQTGRSDLSGPLCNFLVGRNALCYLISDGRAHDTGKGSGVVLTEVRMDKATPRNAAARGLVDDTDGNNWFYDIEVENNGTGEPYSPAALDTLVRINAAICKGYGWTEKSTIQHRWWTRRKIDMSYAGDLWTPIALRILAGKADPLLPKYDITIPSLIVYKDSPEEAFLRQYLSGATKDHEGIPLKNFQLIPIPRDHSWLPDPIPPHSFGVGTHVPGWGQIAGATRYDTLHMILDLLGI